MMKEEIYKKNFEKYTCNKYKDTNSIMPITTDYHDNFLLELSERHPLFTLEESYNTEESFNQYFNNLMYSVSKEYAMIIVEKNGDKVAIKLFHGFKHRREGKPWFKVDKNVDYISANIKTGDVYHGHIRGYQRKKRCIKSIKRNSFFLEPVESLKSKIHNLLTRFTNKPYDEVSVAFSEFMFHIDQRKNFETLNFGDRLFRFYLDKRGYKYPNNFKIFPRQLVGPEIKKILKKNDNKLIDAVMIKNGLSGKKIKQALHVCEGLNIELYKTAKKLFGDDWLNQDEENVIPSLLNSSNAAIGSLNYPRLFSEVISKDELKKVYSLFKQVFIHQNLDSYSFHDHIRMYTELKMFGEQDLKWQSVDNKDEFRKEHLDWTDKIQHYKMGTYQRIYPQYMYKMISQPVFENFYPTLLDSSTKYNDESNHQSNCVKGYIGKTGSIIISVRTGEQMNERATVEYVLTKEGKEVEAKRVQSLGKFNQKLQEYWTKVLLKLDQQVLSCVRDERFETVKIVKECNNGTILNSDSYWDKEGKLRWTHQNIDINHLYRNNIQFEFHG
jgi:hypothetical protein